MAEKQVSDLKMCEIIIDMPMEVPRIWKSLVWNLRESTMQVM